jgi:outer membrane immunogenic protein
MSLNKIRSLFICLAGAFLGMPTAVVAGADSGFYIGAGVGDAMVENSDAGFDESDSAYKLFGGYNIGFIPLVDFAVEASYVDFGKPTATGGSIEVTGFNAYGLAGLSFGPFGIFAKAGAFSWDEESTFGTTISSDSGTDPAYGIGARFAISSFAVRVEYEAYDLGNTDLGMASISGVFTF